MNIQKNIKKLNDILIVFIVHNLTFILLFFLVLFHIIYIYVLFNYFYTSYVESWSWDGSKPSAPNANSPTVLKTRSAFKVRRLFMICAPGVDPNYIQRLYECSFIDYLSKMHLTTTGTELFSDPLQAGLKKFYDTHCVNRTLEYDKQCHFAEESYRDYWKMMYDLEQYKKNNPVGAARLEASLEVKLQRQNK